MRRAMMKRSLKGLPLGFFVLCCALLADCADLLREPIAAPDSAEGGFVVITIGSGMERTVFPKTDQFSKIVLSFVRKDTAGTMPDVEAGLGETLISLNPGTWEITAEAYNAADPPAVVARAKNTLTRNADIVSGDTYFVLAPTGIGQGILRYTVIPPQGIDLDPALSRIRIEKDGEPLSSLNEGGFVAGIKTIDAAIEGGTISLDPGRYVLNIVLDDNAGVNTAVYVESAAIVSGLITEIHFAPETGDFLDPDTWAALSSGGTFGRTWNNSSRVSIGAAGGVGPNRTQALSVDNEIDRVYFTLTKARTQTISLGGEAVEKVGFVSSGIVDGQNASLTLAVFTVDTSAIADFGGSMTFTIGLAENGRTPIVYTVTINTPVLEYVHIEAFPSKFVYFCGEEFDFTGLKLQGLYSGERLRQITRAYTIKGGFDSSVAGKKRIEFEVHGIPARIYRPVGEEIFYYGQFPKYNLENPDAMSSTWGDGSITVDVVSLSDRALYFWHGLDSNYGPSPYPYYTVPNGRTLILNPVKHLIPDNAVYEWEVDGAIQSGYTTEFFPYTANSSSGDHTIRVTAKLDNVTIAAAETTVKHTGGASLRPKAANSGVESTKLYSVVAPGQFGSTSFGSQPGEFHGFGGFGGYAVFQFDHSVEKQSGGEEMQIGGNAFGGWLEPGAIWVSQDDNNNGLPDDTWYELKGSHTLEPLARRNYEITFCDNGSYVDNQGNGGAGRQWWNFADGAPNASELTLVGTDLTYYALNASLWGYADVVDNGRVSLSNAIQVDGTPVDLDFIDFVKIVTAIHYWEPAVNERSTEAYAPKDRSIGDPDRFISGGSGQYTFKNYSGYDLTVESLEGGETFTLNRGSPSNPTTVVKVIQKDGIYIDFYGGNVTLQRGTRIASFRDN
jgi:hypothetical protein